MTLFSNLAPPQPYKKPCSSVFLTLLFPAQARLNGHRFADQQEEYDSLIYKYTTSQEFAPDFVQSYYFPNWTHIIAEPGRR